MLFTVYRAQFRSPREPAGSRREVDTVADWESFTDPVGTTFQNHGGPRAPHYVKYFARRDLAKELREGTALGSTLPQITDLPVGVAHHESDVFMLTTHFMASRSVLQVVVVCSYLQRSGLIRAQPRGDAQRKLIPQTFTRAIRAQCDRAKEQNLISQAAHDFLVRWSTDVLKREPRPEKYKYLEYRWGAAAADVREYRPPIPYDGLSFLWVDLPYSRCDGQNVFLIVPLVWHAISGCRLHSLPLWGAGLPTAALYSLAAQCYQPSPCLVCILHVLGVGAYLFPARPSPRYSSIILARCSRVAESPTALATDNMKPWATRGLGESPRVLLQVQCFSILIAQEDC